MAEEKQRKFFGEKESKKDAEYHKMHATRIMNESLNLRSFVRHKMAMDYEYWHGEQSQDGYDSLFNVWDTTQGKGEDKQELKLPYIYVNFNKVRSRVRVIAGDLLGLGFEANVKAINKEAKSRYHDFKMETLARMATQPHFQKAAAISGIEFGVDNELPKSYQEFEEMMQYSYKQNTEIVIEACLSYNIAYYRYKYMRLRLILDVLICGECHALSYMKNGYPVIEEQNPLGVVYPSSIDDDDHLTKVHEKGFVKYVDIATAIQDYGIKKEEIERLKADLESGDASYKGVAHGTKGMRFFEPFDDNGKRILVFEATWQDTKKVACRTITDEQGEEHVDIFYGEDAEKRFDEDPKLKTKIQRKDIGWPRKATLVGGEILAKDYGEVKYIARDLLSPEVAIHNLVSFKPFNQQGKNVSEVRLMEPIQDFKNFLFTKVQLEIVKSGGSTIAIDTAKIPQDWGDTQEAVSVLLYHMKASGLVFYNSAQGEMVPDGSVPMKSFDTGLGASLGQFIELSRYMDAELDDVSGIDQTRKGGISSANQLASVTAMSLKQSNTMSRAFYDGFFQFESNLLTLHAQHIRMAWSVNPEKFAPAIGDNFHLFLAKDRPEVWKDSFLIEVRPEPISLDRLQQHISNSINQGGLPSHEGLRLELMAQESPKLAIMNYFKYMSRKEQEAQQMQMQQMQMQMQAQQQIEASKQEAELSKIREKGDEERKTVGLKALAEMEKTSMIEGNKMTHNANTARQAMMEAVLAELEAERVENMPQPGISSGPTQQPTPQMASV